MKLVRISLLLLLLALCGAFVMSHAKQANPKKQIIILLGPPGSGKGTQAQQLITAWHIPHISTGDLFRENVGKKTALGEKAKGYMEQGQLVPDQLVIDMLFDRVAKKDCEKGYLLDGFPRTLAQAKALDERLETNHVTAISLQVDDETIVKRMAGRLTCPNGHVHNTYFMPPKEEGICDFCGAKLISREDDKEEVVRERLSVYHKQTKPLIAYYNGSNRLFSFDGEQPPENVLAQILTTLRNTP